MRERSPRVWELRAYAGVDPVTRRKRWKSRTVRGAGKREAEEELSKLVAEVVAGRHRATEGTVEYLMDRWIEQGERLGRSPTTLACYRGYAANNIAPAIGDLELRKLTAAHLDRFYAELERSGRKPATVAKHHAMIRAALNQAMKWGWVDRNVAELASPPTLRQAEIHPPTVDEVRRLLTAAEAKNEDLAVLLWLAATTGARRGELCALRRSDIRLEWETPLDPVGGSLLIDENVIDLPELVELKDTKTHRARRLALDAATAAVLALHIRRQDERATQGLTALVADPYVFSEAIDGSAPWRPGRVTGFFRRLRAKEHLEHVDMHHLRHFMATQAIAAGIDVRTIAGRLGHSGGGAITMRVYAHFLEAADQRAADHMGQLLTPK